jgi:ribosomal protein L29
MKAVEMRKMSTAELATTTTQLREEITALRRGIHMGEATNVRGLRTKRKELARMLTIMSEQLSKETM